LDILKNYKSIPWYLWYIWYIWDTRICLFFQFIIWVHLSVFSKFSKVF
jgi:hypothetical protein